MKLIKCHVENFGTLQSTDIDFESGLTVIKEDNGFGKSTLAVFIKAMFYGLPQSSKRNIDENDRKKYTPWQGGAFGGTIDFEIGGKQYRIERFFASKEKDDTCRVFDLKANTLTDELTDDIGLALFGIDAESFERSVYLPQTDTSTAMSNSIRAKLTGLVENSDDISNFDNAVKALEKRAKEYSVLNGARGAIADKSSEIATLETKRNDALAAAENLKTVEDRLENGRAIREKTVDEIKKVRALITAASDQAARLEQAKRRKETVDELTEAVAKRDALKQRYPYGLPTEDELIAVADTVKMHDEATAEIGVLSGSNADKAELERLNNFFGDTVPTEAEVAEYRLSLNESIKDEAGLEALAARLENARLTEKPAKKGGAGLIILLAAVLAVGGGITLVWQLIAGIILLALGVVMLGVGAFMYLENMIASSNNRPSEDIGALQAEYDRLSTKVQKTKEAVLNFTSKYSSDSPSVVLDIIAQNLRDRNRLTLAVNDLKRKLDQKTEHIEGCKAELSGFFSRFGVGLQGGFADRLSTVKVDCRTMLELDARVDALQKKLSEIPNTVSEVDANAITDKESLVAKERELTDKLSEIDNAISSLEASVSRLTAESDGLTEIEEQLEGAIEQKADMERKLLILKTTLELLKTAKNGLSLKYLDRMTEGFEKYSRLITGDDSGNSMIDTDLEVRLDRGGAARDKEYFSRGYRDMIDIAMRLGLIDALFEDEKPMLILDDPFVNLDDRRLENAMILLKRLANERQIVYLTCHSSRC